MKVALLISGTPRTFVYNEQVKLFNNLKQKIISENNEVDVYLFLKIKDSAVNYIISKNGLKNLKKQLNNLNPKYFKIIYSFGKKYENKNVTQKFKRNYYNQMKPIDNLLNIAVKNKKYDWFIRFRPDFYLDLKSFNFNMHLKNENLIYTTPKKDCKGSCDFFIFSNKMRIFWWNKYISNDLSNKLVNPEYYIFNFIRKNQIIKEKMIYGLVRRYNKIDTWKNVKKKLYPKDYWIAKELFVLMDYQLFKKKILKIVNNNANYYLNIFL